MTRFRGGVQGLGGVEGPEERYAARSAGSGLGERMRALPFAERLLSVGDSGAANEPTYAESRSV